MGGTPWWRYPLSRDGVPPRIGQQMEYLICRDRYASCVHAGGLSCLRILLPYENGSTYFFFLKRFVLNFNLTKISGEYFICCDLHPGYSVQCVQTSRLLVNYGFLFDSFVPSVTRRRNSSWRRGKAISVKGHCIAWQMIFNELDLIPLLKLFPSCCWLVKSQFGGWSLGCSIYLGACWRIAIGTFISRVTALLGKWFLMN